MKEQEKRAREYLKKFNFKSWTLWKRDSDVFHLLDDLLTDFSAQEVDRATKEMEDYYLKVLKGEHDISTVQGSTDYLKANGVNVQDYLKRGQQEIELQQKTKTIESLEEKMRELEKEKNYLSDRLENSEKNIPEWVEELQQLKEENERLKVENKSYSISQTEISEQYHEMDEQLTKYKEVVEEFKKKNEL